MKKKKIMTNYFTALCVDNSGKWMKYRNIKQDKTNTFEKFCKLRGIPLRASYSEMSCFFRIKIESPYFKSNY